MSQSGARDSKQTTLGRIEAVAKAVLFLIGIPTAIITFVALLPQAWDLTHQRNHFYELLRGLHAGFTEQRFIEVLGQPTLQASRGDGLTQYSFVKDEFVVTINVDVEGAVFSYGVLACNPEFRPTFDSEGDTIIKLNDQPLDAAEVLPDGQPNPGAAPRDEVSVAQYYTRGSTFGAVIEPGINSSAGGDHGAYVIGVADYCGDDEARSNPFDEGSTRAEDAATIQRFRSQTVPNYYAEGGSDLKEDSSAGACFVSSLHPEYCGIPIVDTRKLPTSFFRPVTQWWDGIKNLWPSS